jgi:hypothetical protein
MSFPLKDDNGRNNGCSYTFSHPITRQDTGIPVPAALPVILTGQYQNAFEHPPAGCCPTCGTPDEVWKALEKARGKS